MTYDSGNLLAGHPCRDGLELLLAGQCVLISLVDDVINARIVEGEHVIPLQFVMHVEVEHLHRGTHRPGSQEADGLEDEIQGRIQLFNAAVNGHVRAYDDVGAHLPGDVHGEIIAHSTVEKDLSVAAYRPEIEGYGHC